MNEIEQLIEQYQRKLKIPFVFTNLLLIATLVGILIAVINRHFSAILLAVVLVFVMIKWMSLLKRRQLLFYLYENYKRHKEESLQKLNNHLHNLKQNVKNANKRPEEGSINVKEVKRAKKVYNKYKKLYDMIKEFR
ncbi:MAG: hypothetical protein K9L74_03825 [Candidatus Izimaplasma sp.]|nr:hypothetical protein [Candidatus Izimaplasma bacterium]